MTTTQPNTQLDNFPLWPLGVILGAAAALLWALLPTITPPDWLSGGKAAWYLTRASGTVSYFLLAASTIWGLLLSTKLIKQHIPPAISLAMHNHLSWTAIVLSAFHAYILLFDTYYTYTFADLLIPFKGPYAPLWVGLGVLGFYLALLTSASFNWRKRIGQKTWRKLHYLTFLAYIFVTLHGWMAGTDSAELRPLFITSSAVVFFLTLYRILDAVRK